MNNYFGGQLPPEELQRQQLQQQAQSQAQARRQQNAPGQLAMAAGIPTTQAFQSAADPMSAVTDASMFDGDSLDDIIRENNHEMSRRRSVGHQVAYQNAFSQNGSDRNMGMMDFDTPGGDFRNFAFGSMDTSSPTSAGFPTMAAPMTGQPARFAGSGPAGSRPQDYSGIPDMMGGDMMDFSTLRVGPMAPATAQMGIFTTPSDHMEPMSPTFNVDPSMDGMGQMEGPGDSLMNATPNFTGTGAVAAQQQQPQQQAMGLSPFTPSIPRLSRESSGTASYHSPSSGGQNPSSAPSRQPGNTPSAGLGGQISSTKPTTVDAVKPEKNIYSKSGFDMIRALYYVATRPNPEVQLGAVDMSCAFVVCDVTQNDCPIIYVSDNFQNLTGYSRYEIMGRNCRFLQSPDGKVEAGARREFVANDAVYNLKRKVAEGKEIQQSLINYRKGGKPFLNLLTMIPIPWDNKDEIRFFIGFQIDLVECPDAVSGQDTTSMLINYKHSEIPQYIWNPPKLGGLEMGDGQTLGVDDISTLLQQYNPKGALSDWHKQSWDKMLLENTDDVVHVLSLKGLFQYLSPSCKRVLEYDSLELVGQSLSSICHPSDIVPVTRELKEAVIGTTVNLVFRIRRKTRGYTWFESRGSLFIEQGKGRKCIVLIGRKRPVFALRRRDLEANGGIGDSEFWSKLSTSGMVLHASSNVRSLLDLQPDSLVGSSIQELMRKDSRVEFGRSVEKARRGRIVSCRHEVQNRRGQVLQALTVLYPGDASEGEKPTFLLAQTKLLKAPPRAGAGTSSAKSVSSVGANDSARGQPGSLTSAGGRIAEGPGGVMSTPSSVAVALGSQDAALAADDNIFDELKTTRCTSWQFELRQMEKENRSRAEELGQLLGNRKKRKRRKGTGGQVRDCANCHTRNTPEWRRGPSGQRDLCNSCGLRWAKQIGRVSPRNSARGDAQSRKSNGSTHSSPLHNQYLFDADALSSAPDGDKKSSTSSNSPPTPRAGDNGASSGNDSGGSSGAGPKVADLLPPPSQRSGMEMASIREEAEGNVSA